MSDVNEIRKLNDLPVSIGFIADDIKNFTEFDIYHNATFALMLTAGELGARVFHTESNNLEIINNKVFANFNEVVLKRELSNYIKVTNSAIYSLDSFSIIFARKDPPINENFISYIQTLLLVSSNSNSKTFIINNPSGILKANEKLYALNFPNLIPQTLVTYKKDKIIKFLEEHNEAVIKPIFNKGGEGVLYLNKADKKINSIIDSSLKNGTSVALVQKYLPEVTGGDKRIILLNGNPLGAIYRIPKEGEFRANVRRGATIKKCELSKRDLEICETLKPSLIKDEIYFASIDVIGNYLIEVNVTCPASLQEVERYTGRRVAREIVQWAIFALSNFEAPKVIPIAANNPNP